MASFDAWCAEFFADADLPVSALLWAYEAAYKAGYAHGLTVANALWQQRHTLAKELSDEEAT